MPIVDFHTHAFPDSLAERAIASLETGVDWKSETDGTASGLVALMDASGVDRSVLCSIATKPEQAESILKWSLQVRSDRIEPFASIHPHSPRVRDEVEAIAKAGLKGVKIHALYQNFAIDDPEAFPLYEALNDAGLIALFHCGYDIGFGDMDLALPDRFPAVLDRFPGLRVVLAHMGGWRAHDVFLNSVAGRDVYIDTSFSAGYCSDTWRDAILKGHDLDRVLFASDSPWGGMARHVAYVDRFPVSDEAKEKILYKNAEGLLGE